MEEGKSDFKIFTGTPTGMRPLGKPRHRMDLKEVGINMTNWFDLA